MISLSPREEDLHEFRKDITGVERELVHWTGRGELDG
jgi:hypothetical protein